VPLIFVIEVAAIAVSRLEPMKDRPQGERQHRQGNKVEV
jgi:hypothetical protein